MARIYIPNDAIDIFVGSGPHSKTDWLVYDTIDSSGIVGNLLFESLEDSSNLTSIIATLIEPNGDLYIPENGSVAKVRVWIGDTPSNYFTISCNN